MGNIDMSESNYNWVCFSCRTVVRQAKTSSTIPQCHECGCECFCLGYKVAVPKKTDLKAWKKIQKESWTRKISEVNNRFEERVRHIHFLEQEIVRLESLEENKDRRRIINQFKKELTTDGRY